MSENARTLVEWTPSASAVSQEIYRSVNSTGPWTLLATLGASISTYTDSTVDPTPIKSYYYKIETLCSTGSTETSVVTVQCKNCPEENKTYLFGLRNRGTQSSFTYYDTLNLFTNTYYSTSLAYPRTFSIATSTPIHVVCHECGQPITHNGTQENLAYTYLSQQGHIISYLPASPTALGGSSNSNAGTVKQKILFGNLAPAAGRFALGVGSVSSSTFIQWASGYVSNNNNVDASIANPANIVWNFGEMPSYQGTSNGGFTGIRISRQDFALPSGTGSLNFASGLAALTGSNVYLSIVQPEHLNYQNNVAYGGLICEHYIYKLTRRTDWDFSVSGTITHYGFQMTFQAYVDYNGYRIYSNFTDNDHLPFVFNQQPTPYLKIFTL